MKLFLIRHTSVLVPPGTTYGFTDVPLRPTFEEEAARTRARLVGLQFDHGSVETEEYEQILISLQEKKKLNLKVSRLN